LLCYQAVPIIAVEDNLICVEFPIETATYLSIAMAFKAEHCKVPDRVVTWVLVYVMNLYWFATDPTNTASAIGKKQDACSDL
jgi:hypothetical protein